MSEKQRYWKIASSRCRFSTWVVILGTLLSAIGCASTDTTSKVVAGNEWKKGRVVGISLGTIDGRPVPRDEYAEVSPGPHTMSVTVTWSNGCEDLTQFDFEAQPKERYWVLAYELAPGQPRAAANVREFTFGESMGRAGLEGAVTGAAPLLGPIVLIYWGVSKISGHKTPTTRPYDGCCFVWIQEAESGKLVGGERP